MQVRLPSSLLMNVNETLERVSIYVVRLDPT